MFSGPYPKQIGSTQRLFNLALYRLQEALSPKERNTVVREASGRIAKTLDVDRDELQKLLFYTVRKLRKPDAKTLTAACAAIETIVTQASNKPDQISHERERLVGSSLPNLLNALHQPISIGDLNTIKEFAGRIATADRYYTSLSWALDYLVTPFVRKIPAEEKACHLREILEHTTTFYLDENIRHPELTDELFVAAPLAPFSKGFCLNRLRCLRRIHHEFGALTRQFLFHINRAYQTSLGYDSPVPIEDFCDAVAPSIKFLRTLQHGKETHLDREFDILTRGRQQFAMRFCGDDTPLKPEVVRCIQIQKYGILPENYNPRVTDRIPLLDTAMKEIALNSRRLWKLPFSMLRARDQEFVLDHLSELSSRCRGQPFLEAPPNDALTRFLIPVLAGVMHPDNNFEHAATGMDKREEQYFGKTFPAVLTLPDGLGFPIRMRNSTQTITLVAGKALHEATIRAVERKVTLPAERLETEIIKKVSTLAGRQLTSATLLAGLKDVHATDPDMLIPALKLLTPLVASLTEYRLPPLEDLTPPMALRFLGAVQSMLSAHVPERLKRLGVGVDPDIVDAAWGHILDSVQGELSKLKSKGPTEEVMVGFASTKHYFDAYYDALGQNCIGGYGIELERKDFQPIRLFRKDTGTPLGVLYALVRPVEGRRSLILAGIEPLLEVANATSPTKFVRSLVTALDTMKTHNQLSAVFTNIGIRGANGELMDDGRIAQQAGFRSAILSAVGTVIDVRPSESITFPRRSIIEVLGRLA